MAKIIYNIRTLGSDEFVFSGDFGAAWDYLMLNASRVGTKRRAQQVDKLAEKMNNAAIGLDFGHETMWEGMESNGLFFITCSLEQDQIEVEEVETIEATDVLSENSYTVILSASRATNDIAHNMALTTRCAGLLRSKLGQIPMPAVGFYREEGQEMGSHEASLVLVRLTSSQVQWVADLMINTYEQDCILVVSDKSAEAYLWFKDSLEKIGKFKRTTVGEVFGHNAYTQIGEHFFICE